MKFQDCTKTVSSIFYNISKVPLFWSLMSKKTVEAYTKICSKKLTKNLKESGLSRKLKIFFQKIDDLVNNFEKTWIQKNGVLMWNVYDRPQNIQTTNACESWHACSNRKTERNHPSNG